MANIEANIMTYLSTELPTTQFYLSRIPQDGVFPNITYHLISTVPIEALGQQTGLVQCRIQFDCWGTKYADSATLAENLRLKLDGKTVAMGDMAHVEAWRENQFAADPTWNGAGSASVYHRIIADYFVFYTETVPTS